MTELNITPPHQKSSNSDHFVNRI